MLRLATVNDTLTRRATRADVFIAERLESHFGSGFFDREDALELINSGQFNSVYQSGLIFDTEWFDHRAKTGKGYDHP